jgi:hypothetical protein
MSGFELGWLGPDGHRRPLPQLGKEAGPGLEVGPGGRRQGGRLQQRQPLGDRLGPEDLGCAAHRPVGPDQAGQRDEQLGHVVGQLPRARRGFGEPEVQQPGPPVQADQHVGAAQVAVGDTGAMEPLDLGPDGSEQSVTDLGGVEAVQRLAGDVLEDEQDMAIPAGTAVSTAGVRTPARAASSPI